MVINNRKHARFNPQGLTANITLVPAPLDEEITLQGTVIDMSYSGIKIKLRSAMPSDIVESKIKINLTIPETGIPITIQGIIKHLNEQSECGLYYAENNPEHEVDELMFECIKCARTAIPTPTQLRIVNI